MERHVNNHFNGEGSQNGGSKKSMENGNGPAKLMKRNGKKIRFRRQPWSGNCDPYKAPRLAVVVC